MGSLAFQALLTQPTLQDTHMGEAQLITLADHNQSPRVPTCSYSTITGLNITSLPLLGPSDTIGSLDANPINQIWPTTQQSGPADSNTAVSLLSYSDLVHHGNGNRSKRKRSEEVGESPKHMRRSEACLRCREYKLKVFLNPHLRSIPR
jgi:hypothetical protein